MIATKQKTRIVTEVFTAGEKEQNLRSMMREMGRVLVAYSGGVDSAYLAAIATSELKTHAYCVTGISPSVSSFQKQQASEIARKFGLNFRTVETSETNNPDYQKNNADRCFFCKDELYSVLGSLSAELGTRFILDGTNADDLRDHRPGRIAAKNRNVRSPLADVGMTKAEIRFLSRALDLPTWDKPASPCLSSRIAHGVPVTIERLGRIERAEELLRRLGFVEFRVRLHGDLARIEIAKAEMKKIFDGELIEKINYELSRIGFKYITLDLQGFRSGSMNSRADLT